MMSGLPDQEKKEIILERIRVCDHHILSLTNMIDSPEYQDVPGKKTRVEQLTDWQLSKQAMIAQYEAID